MEITHRFKDAIWFREEQEEVLIVGCGGVGSWLAYFLARANFKPTVIDFDKVELHNLGGQMFNKKDIGLYKTEAIKSIIQASTGVSPNTYIDKYGENLCPHFQFTFSCPDSIPTRKFIFQEWKKNLDNKYGLKPILLDGRLEAEQFFIYCVTEETMEMYEIVLNEPVSDATQSCSYQQTTDVAAICAGYMVNFFKNHISNIYENMEVREVPFKFEVFMPLVMPTVEFYKKPVQEEEVANTFEEIKEEVVPIEENSETVTEVPMEAVSVEAESSDTPQTSNTLPF